MKIIAKLIGLERFSKFIVGDFIMKKAIAYTHMGNTGRHCRETDSGYKKSEQRADHF